MECKNWTKWKEQLGYINVFRLHGLRYTMKGWKDGHITILERRRNRGDPIEA